MSAVSVLWTVLTVTFTALWSIAIVSPFWFENIPDPDPLITDNSSFAAFGLLRFCSKKHIESILDMNEWRDFETCSFYTSFKAIPSLFWQFSIIFYGVGLLLSFCSVVLAHISCCHKTVCGSRSIFGVAGILQAVAVVCLMASLVLFPFGFGTNFVKRYCGPSGLFYPGHCKISWAYTLAIMSTALFIFCPIIAKHLFVVTPRSKATVV